MEEQWKQALDVLERIWPRVERPGPPPPPPEGPPDRRPGRPPELRDLAGGIRTEAEARRRYLAMAERSGGPAARTLRAMAAQSGNLLRSMQAEYLLRSGDSLPLPRERERVRSLHAALRDAWNAADRAEEFYRSAAERSRDPELRRLFRDAAAVKERQKQTLRGLARQLSR